MTAEKQRPGKIPAAAFFHYDLGGITVKKLVFALLAAALCWFGIRPSIPAQAASQQRVLIIYF